VAEVWVVNASPVIVLAKVGHLHLLSQLASELVLPIPVAIEVETGPSTDAARIALAGGWGNRVTAACIPSEILEWGLGPGETAVLSVASKFAGRRVCGSMRSRSLRQKTPIPPRACYTRRRGQTALGLTPSHA
jgi:hypothetical protein